MQHIIISIIYVGRLTELDGKCRKVALMTSEDCGIGSSILSRAMSVLTLHDDTYDTKPELVDKYLLIKNRI